MPITPREFLLRLALCRGIGIQSKYQLWQAAESHYDFDHPLAMAHAAGLSLRVREAVAKNFNSQQMVKDLLDNQSVPFLSLVDSTYPPLLRESTCPPVGLWYRGQVSTLSHPCLAVVGARQMSSYSVKSLDILLPPVIKAGVAIVSGLARGVDGQSHQLALRYGGPTIAVVGCGLDRCYPRQNSSLMATIEKVGIVVSEYPIFSPALPYHFPERNRIIAGLCQTLLVTEARQKSGSLITANLALNDNRNVCAVPGRIDAPLSVGTNELISEGAVPVTQASDLLAQFRSCH